MRINHKHEYADERAAFGKYIKIHRVSDGYQLSLQVDHQSFIIGMPLDSNADADWFRSQLCHALSKIVRL